MGGHILSVNQAKPRIPETNAWSKNLTTMKTLYLTTIKTLFMRWFGHLQAEMFSFTTQLTMRYLVPLFLPMWSETNIFLGWPDVVICKCRCRLMDCSVIPTMLLPWKNCDNFFFSINLLPNHFILIFNYLFEGNFINTFWLKTTRLWTWKVTQVKPVWWISWWIWENAAITRTCSPQHKW